MIPVFPATIPPMSQAAFQLFSSHIFNYCGIKMPPQKIRMLEGRLRKRVRLLGMSSFDDYAAHVFGTPNGAAEFQQMIDAITTNKTEFFRESNHFAYLYRHVLPEYRGRPGTSQPMHLWSAGCSSGQEPYSLAMVLSEWKQRHPGFSFYLLASDICHQALVKAIRGIYPEEETEAIPPVCKRKYLWRSRNREKKLVRVVPEIRKAVTFTHLNLVEEIYDVPDVLDVIFCCNVIIYFERSVQEHLLYRFSRLLVPGGYLFLGHSESCSHFHLPFRQMGPTIYRKIPHGKQ